MGEFLLPMGWVEHYYYCCCWFKGANKCIILHLRDFSPDSDTPKNTMDNQSTVRKCGTKKFNFEQCFVGFNSIWLPNKQRELVPKWQGHRGWKHAWLSKFSWMEWTEASYRLNEVRDSVLIHRSVHEDKQADCLTMLWTWSKWSCSRYTGSQCNSINISAESDPTSSLAGARSFWTCCSFIMLLFEVPDRRELQ